MVQRFRQGGTGNALIQMTMNTNWREGYDYPSDDDDVVEYDIMEEADRAYEYQNDK